MQENRPDPYIQLLDGGTGRELQRHGLVKRGSIWSALALIERPDVVCMVHRSFIEAGAQVITTNNYGVVPFQLAKEGMEDRLVELTDLSARLALHTARAFGRRVRVAGSLPPLRMSYKPEQVGPESENLAVYREIAGALAPYVDLFVCETMSTGLEARAAARAAVEHGKPVWVAWSLREEADGRLHSGETVAEAFDVLRGVPVDAYLFNCCSPESIDAALPALQRLTDRPIGGYANAFTHTPTYKPGEGVTALRDEITPERYADIATGWAHNGASIIGGCCGIGPAHIAALRAKFADPRSGH
jgi:S-methylmethionine-dependent homocysteine/selenocysteine methylase